MDKQLIFLLVLVLTLLVFAFTLRRYIAYFRHTRKGFPVKQLGRRFGVMMEVAVGQTKIFRRPLMGLLHALVFWGFLVILIGSIEMLIDGLAGTERVLSFLGGFYNFIMASGDIFALIIALAILVFLFRRVFLHVKRFSGIEMKHISHLDANVALTMILLLMVSLLGMNTFYIQSATHAGHEVAGLFPVSKVLAGWIDAGDQNEFWHQLNWWAHIGLIFVFANYLPYSKHFHVFMSVPNVFLSRLEPLGKVDTMESITREVKIMMDPGQAFASPPEGAEAEEEVPERFGILDVEDVSWKNYFDSLACTECGRCTAVCPANITGKMLSPRKIIMDVRARMKEKGPGLIRKGKEYSDNRTLLRDYISEEELWACTLCNACAQECPININHPSIILGMRRYLVMEESAAPGELNAIFSNIENNGAPWQFSPEDRVLWAEGKVEVPLMADLMARGEQPEYLLWVGSAGAFDDRYKQVSVAFARILNHLGISYATLGAEESSSGDVARRAGNEMLFQMQALMNMEILNGYEVKKIITCDPHAYNTLKNEYPELGGEYEVFHHSQFLRDLMKDGKLSLNGGSLAGKTITYHDPCYLGRANGEYRAPRELLEALGTTVEMKRNKSFALCCGAGGGQMFKEAEKGQKEVFMERTEDALETGANIIATACPYCMVMMTDGLKYKNKEEEISNYDIAELVARNLGL
ncbi:MAG: heterodisulfide reductase-related iron-sulfur binding cluster [Bacteroidales bacterium]|nr:heterodisulfide reductase-related iron-sulfur binding cluster [Bacteroidales bacterium]